MKTLFRKAINKYVATVDKKTHLSLLKNFELSYRILLLKAKLKRPPSFSSKHCSYFLRVQQYKCRNGVRHCNVKIEKSLVLPACACLQYLKIRQLLLVLTFVY